MDRVTQHAILAFGAFAAVTGALFAFFLMVLTGSIAISTWSIEPVWVPVLLSGASAAFFLTSMLLLATGRVRLPASKSPPSD